MAPFSAVWPPGGQRCRSVGPRKRTEGSTASLLRQMTGAYAQRTPRTAILESISYKRCRSGGGCARGSPGPRAPSPSPTRLARARWRPSPPQLDLLTHGPERRALADDRPGGPGRAHLFAQVVAFELRAARAACRTRLRVWRAASPHRTATIGRPTLDRTSPVGVTLAFPI